MSEKDEILDEYEKSQRYSAIAITISAIALIVNAISFAIAIAMRIMQ